MVENLMGVIHGDDNDSKISSRGNLNALQRRYYKGISRLDAWLKTRNGEEGYTFADDAKGNPM